MGKSATISYLRSLGYEPVEGKPNVFVLHRSFYDSLNERWVKTNGVVSLVLVGDDGAIVRTKGVEPSFKRVDGSRRRRK